MKNKVRTRRENTLYFWAMLAVSAMVGGLLGFSGQWVGKSMQELFGTVYNWSVLNSTWLLIALEILIFAVTFFYFLRSRRLQKTWDQEDDEVFDEIDRAQGIAMMATSVGIILNMVVYALILEDIAQKEHHLRIDLAGTVIFLVGIIAITFVQRMIVDETKRLRPEKQGDALEFNFKKTWIESCDEQERQKIYKASYKAFCAGNIMYPVLLVVLMLGQLMFRLGIVPMLVLGLIWLVQTVTYQLESMKN